MSPMTAAFMQLTPLQAAYEAVKRRLPESFDFQQFEAAFSGWECIPVDVNGQTVGALLRNGPEIHACITPAGFRRWMTKRCMSVLNETVERYGRAMTRVQEGNEIGTAFVRRLGFVKVGAVDGVEIYEKVKHGN